VISLGAAADQEDDCCQSNSDRDLFQFSSSSDIE
jgi:hypothetical protein